MYHNYIQELNIHPDEVIVYLRKSRADDPLLSVEEVLARHESILDEWAIKNLGAKVPEENKIKEVVSGETIADRPGIQKMLRLIESPKYKAALVVEVERIGRPDLEDIGRISKLFRFTNTIVITPPKAYDLRDDYDRDAFERELKKGNEVLEYIKKVMSRGTERSKAEGNFVGSIPPFGFDKVWITEGKRKSPTLAINEEQANFVRMVFDLYVNKDMGMPNIAKRLDELGAPTLKGGHWSPSSVKEMLMNVHYIGKIKHNFSKTQIVVKDGEIIKSQVASEAKERCVYDGKHEAIISEELFYKAQDKMGRNHRAKGTTKVANPFASLVWCQCGYAMTLRTYKYRDAQPRLLCINQTHCHTGSCTYKELENMVVDILKQCISDFEIRIKNSDEDAIKMHEKLLKTLEKKMQDLEAKELAQWEAQANPDPSQRMPAEIFKRLNEKLLNEKKEVEEAMYNARKTMPDPTEYQEKLVRFKDALEALLDPEVDAEKKNRLLKACIDKIIYHRDKPERIKNPEKKTRKNTRLKGKYAKQNVLSTGGHWTNPPIELDVKLRV